MNTKLLEASKKNDLEMLKQLIYKEYDANSKDYFKTTAFSSDLKKLHLEVVEFLKDNGQYEKEKIC